MHMSKNTSKTEGCKAHSRGLPYTRSTTTVGLGVDSGQAGQLTAPPSHAIAHLRRPKEGYQAPPLRPTLDCRAPTSLHTYQVMRLD